MDEPFNIHDEIKLNLNEQTILIKTAASKTVYKELRNRTITPPTAQLKFNAKFVDDVLEWKEICSLPWLFALPWMQNRVNFSTNCSTDVW